MIGLPGWMRSKNGIALLENPALFKFDFHQGHVLNL